MNAPLPTEHSIPLNVIAKGQPLECGAIVRAEALAATEEE